MAFKGTQGPDLVSLALNIMQMKRDREFEDRRLSLEEFKAQEAARTNAIQAQRDDAKFGLEMKEREAKLREAGVSLDSTLRDNEMKMGPTLDLVNDPKAAPDQRYAAARQFDQFVQSQGSQFQRPPEAVGANIGAGRGLMLQTERQADAVKETDAARADRYAAQSDARAERYRIAKERRDAEAADLQSQAEQNAVEAGKWTGENLDKVRTSQESKLAFSADTTKDWRRLESLKESNPQDVFELIQRWQRRVDQGATVREGDIAMISSVGASGASQFAATAQAFFDKNKKFPPGFGAQLKQSLEGMLTNEDQKIVDLKDEFDTYAESNGWSPAQKARASAYDRQANLARERLAKRAQPADTRPRRPLSASRARALGLE